MEFEFYIISNYLYINLIAKNNYAVYGLILIYLLLQCIVVYFWNIKLTRKIVQL